MTAKVRTYRGYTIERTVSSGMWLATRLGSLPLRADTLDGMRHIIRQYPNGR